MSSSIPLKAREIHLVSRPKGVPTPDNFRLVETTLAEPKDGQALVENLFMSVDPYMRGRMNDTKSYVPPFELERPMQGGAIGRVVASRSSKVKQGDIVLSHLGWRDAFVEGDQALTVVDPSVTPLSAYLGVLGTTGMTAWVGMGLMDLKPSDVVFVSAAAGATGSVAGQLAKLRGCRVMGSAGGPAKVAAVRSQFGFDAAFDYKTGDLVEHLREVAPEGIDVYFDNVGGDQLEAALTAMRNYGRIAACGAISRYNDAKPQPGPNNLFQIIAKRLTIKGFIVSDHMARYGEFVAEIAPHVKSGRIKATETVVEGLDNAPRAFLDLLAGQNTGKMIVSLGRR